MKNRIRELRQARGIKQAELAAHLGVAQNTLSYWEQGKYDVDNSSLQKIADFFQCTVDYILCRDSAPIGSLPFDNIFPIQTKKFPLLGEIACGEPIFVDEDRESYIQAGTNIQADFCLKCKGDSMRDARILDGDIVFIRKQPTVENGQIAAVIIDNEATLKRVFYYPDSDKLVLAAANSHFEPLVYVGEELNQIRVLGLAVAFQSDAI